MLRTNLSTRPFYNVRAVNALLGVVGTLVALATVYNGVEIARLASLQRSLSGDAVRAETEADRLTQEARQVRSRINPAELTEVSAAAKEANALIDRRAFSWTTLLAQFESALPPEVRITAVQPRRESDGSFEVSIAVQARRVEGVDTFIENLESLGTFKNVLPVEEEAVDGGFVEAVLDGRYLPDVATTAVPASVTTEGGDPVAAQTVAGERPVARE